MVKELLEPLCPHWLRRAALQVVDFLRRVVDPVLQAVYPLDGKRLSAGPDLFLPRFRPCRPFHALRLPDSAIVILIPRLAKLIKLINVCLPDFLPNADLVHHMANPSFDSTFGAFLRIQVGSGLQTLSSGSYFVLNLLSCDSSHPVLRSQDSGAL